MANLWLKTHVNTRMRYYQYDEGLALERAALIGMSYSYLQRSSIKPMKTERQSTHGALTNITKDKQQAKCMMQDGVRF